MWLRNMSGMWRKSTSPTESSTRTPNIYGNSIRSFPWNASFKNVSVLRTHHFRIILEKSTTFGPCFIFCRARREMAERRYRMKKIDWVRKLTSRKFWLSIASFVAMLMVALGQPEATATQVTSLIMAGATVIGYVIGEGLADSGNAGAGEEEAEEGE